ncbi:MAG TPA: restriction endonuclease [Terriglobales bacterium]|jgi:restriction system protein|nr:restriction endonuclease [Terriglobales bacterium]
MAIPDYQMLMLPLLELASDGQKCANARFTEDAIEYVQHIEKKIVLINGEELAQLMINHNISVSEVANYSVKKIDNDYFEEAD